MSKYPYNVGSAVIYSTALLITLWWIPILGPIIIGYITGRKAGGPIKGLIAMAIPVTAYFLIVHAIHIGLINIPPTIKTYITGMFLSTTAGIPYLNYIEKTFSVAMNVGLSINHYVYYAPPSFFIMFSFSFIGGAISRQIILERGIYKEKKSPFTRKVKEINEEEDTTITKRRNFTPEPVRTEIHESPRMHRAPVEYASYPQTNYAQMQNNPYYNNNPQQYGNAPVYPNQYPPYPPQYQQFQQQIPQRSNNLANQRIFKQSTPQNKPVNATSKKQKTSSKRRRKKIKQFQVEENNKFVVHEMEPPKNVVIKKRNNRDHSIAFL